MEDYKMKALETKLRTMRSNMTEPMAARTLVLKWLVENLSFSPSIVTHLVLKLDIRNHESIQLFLFNVEDLAS